MFKHILEGAGNINWMAIFALITFFSIFLISAITVLKSKPAHIKKMSHLPLEGDHPQNAEKDSHEE